MSSKCVYSKQHAASAPLTPHSQSAHGVCGPAGKVVPESPQIANFVIARDHKVRKGKSLSRSDSFDA
eukprot:2253758-Pleurochrysis_carterae.AAC.1